MYWHFDMSYGFLVHSSVLTDCVLDRMDTAKQPQKISEQEYFYYWLSYNEIKGDRIIESD